MSDDKQKIRATFEKLLNLSKDRLIAEVNQNSKEVLSNLVLANASAFRRLLDEITIAKRAMAPSKNPDEYKALEKANKTGRKFHQEISCSLNQNKTALQKSLQNILDGMTKLERHFKRVIKKLNENHSASNTHPNWNEAIQTMFQSDSVTIPPQNAQNDLPILPAIWDEAEAQLLPMACASNTEWGLSYTLDGEKRVAFFPATSQISDIENWCDAKKQAANAIGISFELIAIYDVVGAKV